MIRQFTMTLLRASSLMLALVASVPVLVPLYEETLFRFAEQAEMAAFLTNKMLLPAALGFVLARLGTAADGARKVTAALGLAGLLMPVGILGELYLGLSPVFVLLGAVAMTASVVLSGILALRHWSDAAVAS